MKKYIFLYTIIMLTLFSLNSLAFGIPKKEQPKIKKKKQVTSDKKSILPKGKTEKTEKPMPRASLQRAKNAFVYGNYQEAIQLFKNFLKHSKSLPTKQQQNIHKNLGLSYYYVSLALIQAPDVKKQKEAKSYKKKARGSFLEHLKLKPSAKLDPALYRPDLVSFFNDIRSKNKQLLAKLQQAIDFKKKKEKEQKVQIITLRQKHYIYEQSPWINVLPFGIPQFTRKHNLKGALLLTGQVISLGVNITSYQVIVSQQIQEGSQKGRFAKENIKSIRKWQIAQLTSIGIFAGFVIYGAIDAYIYYEKQRESIIPDLQRINPKRFRTLKIDNLSKTSSKTLSFQMQF